MGTPDGSARPDGERDWFTIAVRAVVVVVVAAGWGAYFVTQHGWALALPFGGARFASPPPSDAPARNAIAYVTAAGEVWVTDPEGGQGRRVGETRSPYPALTWSRDGRYLAYMDQDRRGNGYLAMASMGAEEAVDFFRDPARRPIYCAWSPDGSALALLLQEERRMSLNIAPLNDPADGLVLTGAPSCYFNWRPGGGALLASVGDSRLSIFDTATGAEATVSSGMAMMQTPAWPERDAFYYLASGETGSEFRRSGPNRDDYDRVGDSPWSCRAVASPDGRYLAYSNAPLANLMPLNSRGPGAIHVLETATGRQRELACGGPAFAFFWSPDSSKLMLMGRRGGPGFDAGPGEDDRLPMIGRAEDLGGRWHRLWLYDLASDTCVPLVQCRMSRGFLQMLPYFDQYAHSVQYWSPDSRYFVVTARQHAEHAGDVWILDTTGESMPRLLAEGTTAAWSWQ